MKLPSFDKDLKTDEMVLATEGVLGVVSGLTMVGNPQTAHVREPLSLSFCSPSRFVVHVIQACWATHHWVSSG
jgi:hypothetical protein